MERFEREAKAAASLNHPNIVSVYDRGKTGGGAYYIAMEHVPGGTLKDRILKEGPLEAAEVVHLGAQVADALGVAHAGGIVHRDVKPQNVLLTADGDAKVADFGIARAASATSLSNSSLVLGTAHYMSPEQAMGDPTGPASDLYSLGVVLYEALTGGVPFDADSAVGVAMKHVTESPRPPKENNPAVPRTLEAVVMKLLEKKPEDRYPGAAELVTDLRRAGDGLPPILAASSWRSSSEAETTQALVQPLASAPAPGKLGEASRGFARSPRKGRSRLLAIALVALLVLIGAAVLGLSEALGGGPVVGSLGKAAEEAAQALGVGEAGVPKVVGLTEDEARRRLEEEGFGVAVERRASGEKDEGMVLEQSVPADEEVRKGSRIALAVGSGPQTVKAPDLVGLTLEEARTKIDEADLKLGGHKGVPSEEVAEGEVAAQVPAAGKKTEAGTEVSLTVSSGPAGEDGPDRVDVPDVSGLGADAATALIQEAGCEVAGTRTEPSPEPEGTVVGTDPPIGTAVALGTPVTLIVSGGQGAPPAGAPSGEPDAQPAPPSSASATASAGASASPDPPSESEPPQGPPDIPPSSPEPAPSSPAPSSPPPSSSASPTPSSPAPAPSPSPPPASSAAPASPSPEPEDAEDTEEGSE